MSGRNEKQRDEESQEMEQGVLFELPSPAAAESAATRKAGRRPAEKPKRIYDALADVAFAYPIGPLSYGVPSALIGDLEVGALVQARLRGRIEIGVVVGSERGEAARERAATIKGLQPLLRRVSGGFRIPDDSIDLGRWMAEYYQCSLGEALGCISFIGSQDVSEGRRVNAWRLAAESDESAAASLTKRQRQVLEWFRLRAEPEEGGAAPTWTQKRLHEELGVTTGVLRRLVEAACLEEVSVLDGAAATAHDSAAAEPPEADRTPPELTAEQAEAALKIHAAIDSREYATFLLQGVTGSGKTEVYLRALRECVERGRTGIVLVPEISLTPQTVGRFRARFGDRVGVYHSRLSAREKFALSQRIADGEIDVVIGARSAVFAPLAGLGLVVVDEEHESSFKQESVPRYHARDVAIMRASREGAVVILGSATPSIESVYNAEAGKFTRLRLKGRVNETEMPPIELIDMGRETREGGIIGGISRPLRLAMREAIERGEQVLLLLNRRGYTSFFYCPTCRAAVQCPTCDVTLTHHQRGERMECHLCGHRSGIPRECPKCEGEFNRIGLGTERLEDELTRLFPGKRVLRLDRDTTSGKSTWEEIWRELNVGDVDIIFGTQMIAKGLHLERVTCVGVVLADITLAQPDFRAQERAFSLITQVAGRAGRGDRPGKVYVQTYQPHHYALRMAAAYDFETLYREELRRRRLPQFPPFGRLVALTLSGEDDRALREASTRLAGELRLQARAHGVESVAIFGPTPAPIARIKGMWRRRILMRDSSHSVMRRLLASARQSMEERGSSTWRKLRLTVDVDPQDLM